MSKCIIAGSRAFPHLDIKEYSDWTNDVKHASVYNALDQAVKDSGFTITSVISGTAWGMDRLGEQWAKRAGVPVTRKPADWSRFGKRAGFVRNKQMAETADCLICIHCDSNGAKHMIEEMKKLGKPVYEVKL